jgi:hypothetical protein
MLYSSTHGVRSTNRHGCTPLSTHLAANQLNRLLLELLIGAVVQSLTGSDLLHLDNVTTESKRFMAIISAPILLNRGRQVNHGFFCHGCRETNENAKHFSIKYTTEEMSEHIASCERVVEVERIPRARSHRS